MPGSSVAAWAAWLKTRYRQVHRNSLTLSAPKGHGKAKSVYLNLRPNGCRDGVNCHAQNGADLHSR